MKLTKSKLKQIIQEEFNLMFEQDTGVQVKSMPGGSYRITTAKGRAKLARKAAADRRKETGVAGEIDLTPETVMGSAEHIKKYNLQPGEKIVYISPTGNVTYTHGKRTPEASPLSPEELEFELGS